MLDVINKCKIYNVNDEDENDSLIAKISSKREESFFLCDLSDVIKKYNQWKEKVPKVAPYYAIKANPYPVLIKLLINLGAGFDCATKGEIKKVLSLGGKPEKIIFASPTKFPSHIQYAKDNGVDMMTFDSVQEIYKTKDIFPDAKLVLRIRCDSLSSTICLGKKYGCDPHCASNLLRIARDLDMNVIGICFHVGTENRDPTVFKTALSLCHELFEEAKTIGYNFTFLDIGGGFLGDSSGYFQKDAEMINKGIDKYFNDPNIKIISEPGRYFCDAAFTLITKVISIRETFDGIRFYYLNDGVYKNFSAIYFEGKQYANPKFLKRFETNDKYMSTLWGETLDTLDSINGNISLPKLNIDDVLIWEYMGAYTLCVNTNFHEFAFTEVINTIQDKDKIYITELN